MKSKTGRAARKAGPIAEPKPPFPKQHQMAPGLESKLKPRPRFEAEAYKAAGKLGTEFPVRPTTRSAAV